MTVKQLMTEMDAVEIETWFAFYELEAEERNAQPTPAPFQPVRRTIGGR